MVVGGIYGRVSRKYLHGLSKKYKSNLEEIFGVG